MADAGRTPEEVRAALAAAVVVPVIRADTAGDARRTAEWAIGQGLPAIELTATIPGWRDLLTGLAAQHPGVAVGMGTLLDPGDAEDACDRGAAFLVSPLPAPEVARVAAERGLLTIGGGFTPAELLAAADHGIAKLFPAHAAGPRYLRSVLAVLPGAEVIPTGGIAFADVPAWLEAGALCVGMGSELRPGPEAEAALERLR